LVLDGYAAAHSGYHLGGYLFDVFLYNDGGIDRLVSGPLWSGTAYGPDQVRSAAISRLNGIWVNTAPMTARFGNSSGNTVTVPANRGTYVGTALSYEDSAPGSPTEVGGKLDIQFGSGSEGWISIWNCYNRVPYDDRAHRHRRSDRCSGLPWWLPSLADVSSVAAELLPVAGLIWIVVKIITRIIEVRRGS
jgi:hypothetical protein